ncbi:MAG: hypothetical protein KAS23_14485 [Anaerohalosphaera sp.]|nr:hypothetical protein [Anaerohalosphaera sp.]
MIAIMYLLMCMLYFVCIGLDVTMFFLQVRLLLTWRSIEWLIPFEVTGRPVTDMVAAQLSKILQTNRPLSERGTLTLALIITALLRIVLGSLINLK